MDMLFNIFVTQVFAFLETEWAALGGLALNVLAYLALRFMLDRETSRSASEVENVGPSRVPA